MVKYFTIEDDPAVLILKLKRLLTMVQINDGQAGMRQAELAVTVNAELVRPPVLLAGGHGKQRST